jgi:hypothetical protein
MSPRVARQSDRSSYREFRSRGCVTSSSPESVF